MKLSRHKHNMFLSVSNNNNKPSCYLLRCSACLLRGSNRCLLAQPAGGRPLRNAACLLAAPACLLAARALGCSCSARLRYLAACLLAACLLLLGCAAWLLACRRPTTACLLAACLLLLVARSRQLSRRHPQASKSQTLNRISWVVRGYYSQFFGLLLHN
jgi:hypothetical protein